MVQKKKEMKRRAYSNACLDKQKDVRQSNTKKPVIDATHINDGFLLSSNSLMKLSYFDRSKHSRYEVLDAPQAEAAEVAQSAS